MQSRNSRIRVLWMPAKSDFLPSITPYRVPREMPASAAMSLMREASEPAPQRHETVAKKLFDYDEQIQPSWDKHCVECHNAENSEGDLNLAGDHEGVYSVSYNQLIALGKKNQLLGNRKLRDEDTGSQPIEYIPPYTLGALSSPLAAWLSGGRYSLHDEALQAYAEKLKESHPDVKLSDAELLTITNWLDVNCPYHPSYWGRLNVKYQEHPNCRPNVTFEEAVSETLPESIRRAEAARGLTAAK